MTMPSTPFSTDWRFSREISMVSACPLSMTSFVHNWMVASPLFPLDSHYFVFAVWLNKVSKTTSINWMWWNFEPKQKIRKFRRMENGAEQIWNWTMSIEHTHTQTLTYNSHLFRSIVWNRKGGEEVAYRVRFVRFFLLLNSLIDLFNRQCLVLRMCYFYRSNIEKRLFTARWREIVRWFRRIKLLSWYGIEIWSLYDIVAICMNLFFITSYLLPLTIVNNRDRWMGRRSSIFCDIFVPHHIWSLNAAELLLQLVFGFVFVCLSSSN